jgi:hypothetical protein
MKYFTLVILSAFTIDLFSQSVELPPDSLIKKYHIKTITSYFNDDSIKNELSKVWKFDHNGKLISEQLFDNEDTTTSIELFFYKENLLTEYWHTGSWGKYDTLKIIYFYDNKNRISQTISTGNYNPFNQKIKGFRNTIKYAYINDSITLKTYEGNALTVMGSAVDSLVYNPNKTIKYLFKVSEDLKIIYKYNSQKQLINETWTSISYPNKISSYKKYFYDNRLLVKEISGRSKLFGKKGYYETKYLYNNNDKGLLIKLKRPETFDTYTYEYYK